MRRRARIAVSIATVISLMACLALSAAWTISYQLNAHEHGITLAPHFHVGFFDGCISLYNQDEPYRGSIISINDRPPILVSRDFDAPGV